MKARLGWLVAVVGAGAVALSAAAQGGAKLAVGPDAGGYLCPDGRKIWVSRCYDQSAQASCQVVHLHVKNNGLNPETASTRTELLAGLKNCVLTPLEFTNSGVNLVSPKSAPQQTAKAPAASPAGSTVVVPGTGGKPVALARLVAAADKAIVFYIEENSRKQLAQADTVGIWSLWVYPEGHPQFPGATAAWVEYAVDCKANSFELGVMVQMDRQAKVLDASKVGRKEPIAKGSMTEVIAGVACKTGKPLAGPRLTTAAAAIADAKSATALAQAPPTPGAKSTIVLPGGRPLSLARLPTAQGNSIIYYVEELSAKPRPQTSIVSIWTVWVYLRPKPEWPGVTAHWVEYHIDCKANAFEVGIMVSMDAKATVLSAANVNEKAKITKNTVADVIAGVACKTGKPLAGPRLTTAAAAIADAMPASAAKPAASPP